MRRRISGKRRSRPMKANDLDRRAEQTFDDLACRYGDEGLSMEEINRRAAAALAVRLEGRILDVGCGNGGMLEKYVRDDGGRETVALDLSWWMLRRAERRTAGREGLRFVRGDALRLPFRDGAFDAALCVNTLHNLPSRGHVARALGEIARTVRSGGQVLFDFRNAWNPFRLWVALRHDRPALPQKVLSRAWIVRRLRALGFETIEMIPVRDDFYEAYCRTFAPTRRIGLAARKALDRSPAFAARLIVRGGK